MQIKQRRDDAVAPGWKHMVFSEQFFACKTSFNMGGV